MLQVGRVPHTLLVKEENAQLILRMVLLRQGTDILEATLESDEDMGKRLNRY
jgi:hypothetical protein